MDAPAATPVTTGAPSDAGGTSTSPSPSPEEAAARIDAARARLRATIEPPADERDD